ncbi:MAG: molybdopterin-dependent oxidoreductase [Alphaproteobacteria bacterium]|nr:molybdopterin-dependent oxidoreductase [Alphaproteobacteria bacterium]
MPDKPLLPAHASGPPVRGEPGVASLVPFGPGGEGLEPYRAALSAALENRDTLPYAWSLLRHGVCGQCALGPRGLQDAVTPGTHLCGKRLEALRDQTRGSLAPADLLDIERLRRMSPRALEALGRIPYPFVYRRGDRGFTRVEWDEAIGIAADALRETPPARQGWLAGGQGLSNEDMYLFAKAARAMGSNNVALAARPSHAHSGDALAATLGRRAATASFRDLIGADLILVWGADLARSHPMLLTALHHAKRAGSRVVVINACIEPELSAAWLPTSPSAALLGSRLVDDLVQVRIGGDLALISAVLKRLVSWQACDVDFIEAHTRGFDALRAQLDGLDLRALCAASGVAINQVDWLADLVARAGTMVSMWSEGLSAHDFGADNVRGLVNLHLSQGAVGVPHSGLLPLPALPGLPGAEDCGLGPALLPGALPLHEDSARSLGALWGFEVPTSPGLDAVGMARAAAEGALDFLYCLGASLSGLGVREAFAGVHVRVHQDTVLRPSALREPGEWLLLLPAQTRHEVEGGSTITSAERRVRLSPEVPGHPYVGEAEPAWSMPGDVVVSAVPTLEPAFEHASTQEVREEMDRCMPHYKGIAELHVEGDQLQWGGPRLHQGGVFSGLPEGKALFSAVTPPALEAPEGLVWVHGRRAHPAAGDTPEVLLSEVDARRLGLREGDAVRLSRDGQRWFGVARLVEAQPGCVQVRREAWPALFGGEEDVLCGLERA